RRIMPLADDALIEEKVRHANRILRTRARDVEETLVQLVHDEDPVVAAAAIQFCADRRLRAFAGDFEYVLAHRAETGPWVHEAARWARGVPDRAPAPGPGDEAQPRPTVVLASALRDMPCFELVSVDELFRIAQVGRQVVYDGGRPLCLAGARAHGAHFLLEGAARVGDAGPLGLARAPAAIGLNEVLEGRPFRCSATTVGPAVVLTLDRDDLLTMLSDSPQLVEGLLRARLARGDRPQAAVYPPRLSMEAVAPPAHELPPIDRVRWLRRSPLFERTGASQLLDVAASARDVPLEAGSVLFAQDREPAVFQIVAGEVSVETATGAPAAAGPGSTIGVVETLVGEACGRRAVVVRGGRALRIERDRLFEALADHVELLQHLFGSVLA